MIVQEVGGMSSKNIRQIEEARVEIGRLKHIAIMLRWDTKLLLVHR
jgi:hypothetical protein